jgi:hypothetical protein
MDDMTDWKLKLRYGKIHTDFKHYTVLADGMVGELVDGFQSPPGPAWMVMKLWASDPEEVFDMVKVIGNQIGFEVTGKIEVYDSEPEQPPRENPYSYYIDFKPYNA